MTDTTTAQPARRPRRMAREADASGLPNADSIADNVDVFAEPDQAPATRPSDAARVTKAGQVLAMLQRPEGASLEDLVALTGWLSHTARAALTGLRKKGHRVTSEKTEGGARMYRIIADEQSASPAA